VEAALAGQGVALASRFLVIRELDAGRLARITDPDYRGTEDFHLLARREPDGQSAVSGVRKWLPSNGELGS